MMYPCKHCGKEYASKQALGGHIKSCKTKAAKPPQHDKEMEAMKTEGLPQYPPFQEIKPETPSKTELEAQKLQAQTDKIKTEIELAKKKLPEAKPAMLELSGLFKMAGDFIDKDDPVTDKEADALNKSVMQMGIYVDPNPKPIILPYYAPLILNIVAVYGKRLAKKVDVDKLLEKIGGKFGIGKEEIQKEGENVDKGAGKEKSKGVAGNKQKEKPKPEKEPRLSAKEARRQKELDKLKAKGQVAKCVK